MKRILVLMLLLTTPIMGGDFMEENMRQFDQAVQENELWALRGEAAEREEWEAKKAKVIALARQLENENRQLRSIAIQYRDQLAACQQQHLQEQALQQQQLRSIARDQLAISPGLQAQLDAQDRFEAKRELR